MKTRILALVILIAATAFSIPGVSFAAIAFDTANSNAVSNNSATLSLTHTAAGPNGIGFAYVATNYAITGVTWNGAAMTLVATGTPTNLSFGSLYYILNPATTSASVIATRNNSGNTSAFVLQTASYTGVNQSSTLNATSSQKAGSIVFSYTSSITLPSSAWVIMASDGASQSWTNSAGTGSTKRTSLTPSAYNGSELYDSNGAQTGTYSMTASFANGNVNPVHIMAGFTEAGGGASAACHIKVIGRCH